MSKMELSWVLASDLDEAIDFYINVVGLKLTEKHDLFGWAELQGSDGGARLGIGVMGDENLKPGSNAVVTLTVDDLDAAKADMEAKGAKMVGDIMEVPGMVRLQTFVDPDGNSMQLVQYINAEAMV